MCVRSTARVRCGVGLLFVVFADCAVMCARATKNEVRHSLECQPYRRRSSPSPRERRRVVGNHHLDRAGSMSSRNRRRRIVQEEGKEETDRVTMR
jgi:hypothetical protein